MRLLEFVTTLPNNIKFKKKCFIVPQEMLILLVNNLLEGKSRNSGLRIGEMEKDALVAHGTNAIIQDMFKNNTDAIDIRKNIYIQL